MLIYVILKLTYIFHWVSRKYLKKKMSWKYGQMYFDALTIGLKFFLPFSFCHLWFTLHTLVKRLGILTINTNKGTYFLENNTIIKVTNENCSSSSNSLLLSSMKLITALCTASFLFWLENCTIIQCARLPGWCAIPLKVSLFRILVYSDAVTLDVL